MMFPRCLITVLSIFVVSVYANVEKTIFIAPEAVHTLNDASIDNLLIIPLSPQRATARTYLNATFPTDVHSRGSETWMLLDGLTSGSRYEVRICWLATQPTEFSIYTHTIADTFHDPELLSSLSSFSYTRRSDLDDFQIQKLTDRKWKSDSALGTSSRTLLFLQIFAAADYFSLNRTLMETVPPVLVDIILDHYILNVFPKSLVPTAGYILILAISAWFISGYVWEGLKGYAHSDTSRVNVDKKKK